MAEAANVSTPGMKVSGYDLPEYITSPSLDLSGFLKDYYSSMVNPTTGMGATMPTGLNTLQSSALAQVPNAVGAWGDIYNQGRDLMTQGGNRLANTGVWDPNKLNEHLNPYTSGILGQMSTLGNRNLLEDILPNINSTFTGAGQFGSTRNADFDLRAIRDTQEAISNAQGQALNTAFGQASNDYLNWDKSGQSAGGALGQLGQNLGQYGISGGQQNWNDITNAYKMGDAQRSQETTDWMNAWQTPMSAATSMSGILSSLKQGVQPTQTTASTLNTSSSDPYYNLIRDAIGGIFG